MAMAYWASRDEDMSERSAALPRIALGCCVRTMSEKRIFIPSPQGWGGQNRRALPRGHDRGERAPALLQGLQGLLAAWHRCFTTCVTQNSPPLPRGGKQGRGARSAYAERGSRGLKPALAMSTRSPKYRSRPEKGDLRECPLSLPFHASGCPL